MAVVCNFAITHLVLLKSFFNILPLTTLFMCLVSVKVNPAIYFLIIGTTLYLLNTDLLSLAKRHLACFRSYVILIFKILMFNQFLFGWNFGIEELLLREIH